MLPQDIYAEKNELFGIPQEISSRVGKLMDTELRNIRRVPKKKFLLKIMNTTETEKAFWMYYLLNLLTERITSTIILDLDPLKYKDNIFNGTKVELDPIIYKIRRYAPILVSVKNLKKEFYEKLPAILRNDNLISWIRENIVNPRISREEIPLEDAIQKIYSKVLRMKRGYVRGLPSQVKGLLKYVTSLPKGKSHMKIEVKMDESKEPTYDSLSKLDKLVADKFMYSELYYNIFKLISYRTRVYDHLVVAGYPIYLIGETLFRVSKRRATGLGRDVLRCLEELEDEDKIKECISKHLDSLNNIYIKKHGLNLDSSIKKYVEMVIEADRIIDMLLSKYPYTLHRD